MRLRGPPTTGHCFSLSFSSASFASSCISSPCSVDTWIPGCRLANADGTSVCPMRGVGKLAPATQSEKSIVSIVSIDVANRSAFLRIAGRCFRVRRLDAARGLIDTKSPMERGEPHHVVRRLSEPEGRRGLRHRRCVRHRRGDRARLRGAGLEGGLHRHRCRARAGADRGARGRRGDHPLRGGRPSRHRRAAHGLRRPRGRARPGQRAGQQRRARRPARLGRGDARILRRAHRHQHAPHVLRDPGGGTRHDQSRQAARSSISAPTPGGRRPAACRSTRPPRRRCTA